MDILDLLSSGKFLLINKNLARKIGVDATLLLAELLNKNGHWKNEGKTVEFDGIPGYFYATIESIEEETTLTRKAQDSALRRLKDAGFVTHILKGLPAKRYFLINEEKIYEFFGVQKISASLSEKYKLDCPKGTNCVVPFGQTGPYIVSSTIEAVNISTTPNPNSRQKKSEKSPDIPIGGGGLSNSLELVKFKSKSGKELQITVSELKKHLEEFPADVIEKAVEEIDSNKPITNILKYTKSICKRLYSEGHYVSVSKTPVKKCLSREEQEKRWIFLGIKPQKEPTKEDRQAQREADERRKKVLERANMKAWQIKKLEREEAEKKRPSPLGQTEANDTVGGEYR
jgi:hypothetical protein